VTHFNTQVATDYERAQQRAFLNKLRALLFGRTKELRLLSFDEVREKIGWDLETYIGMREVPVDAIVGSVGRYQDFDREFLPVQRATRQRWQSIDRAYYDDVDLPPVQLYKVGDAYFVKDGNHRVSVARERGVHYIDAEVIECRPKVALTPAVTADDLETIGEYSAFLKWSELDRLRPDQDMSFTTPGGYNQLREHILVHGYYLGIERSAPVPLLEAVASWYDYVYMPVVRLIRDEKVLERFPRRTEADLYLWIMDHLYYLREQATGDVDAGEAVSDFAEQFGRVSLIATIRHMIRHEREEDMVGNRT
jgi:hypothetical protein